MKSLFLVFALMQMVFSTSSKMVVYWGQNSAGSFTTAKDLQEKPLRHYCEDSSYDIIVVGFVYLFPATNLNADATLPGMNFANHCEEPFNQANPYVLNCTTNVAPDISYCQSRGKQILLSFGGGVGNYGFTSDAQAVTFAHTVWNMFLGGSGAIRPFGNAIFDGVDLDIEGGSAVGYVAFINTLRAHFASGSRSYYISAAPQCFYPDRIGPGAGTPLTDGWFDYIWIQFYNNHCGVHNFGTSAFNWATWAESMKKAANPNVKLFLGAPASVDAAASGYVELNVLQTIATAISATYPQIYGGIMLWDVSTSDMNNDFGPKVGAFVHGQSINVPSTPVSTPAASVTTGRVIASTTGRVIASTTAAMSVPVISAPTPATPSTPISPPVISTPPTSTPSTPSSTVSNTTACTIGYMKCLTATTFSTCNWNVWGSAQNCGSGTVCNPSGNFVYCVAGSSPISVPTPVSPPEITPRPPAPVISTPTPTVTPPTVAPAPVSTPSASSSTSTTGSTSTVISTPSSTATSCTLGEQQCVGSNTYRTCGNGRDGPMWYAAQSCQTGLSCHSTSTSTYVYCY